MYLPTNDCNKSKSLQFIVKSTFDCCLVNICIHYYPPFIAFSRAVPIVSLKGSDLSLLSSRQCAYYCVKVRLPMRDQWSLGPRWP